MKIRNRRIAYLGIISLLASLITGLFGYTLSSTDIRQVKDELLRSHVENNINLTMKYLYNTYGNLTVGEGTLLDSNGQSIEGHLGLVDTVLEDLGDESTIFVRERDDFKRIATNVMSPDNERALGTYLGRNHRAYQTVIAGDTYVGEAEIFDEKYYTAYKPIKDNNGNVIGLLFVGTPTADLDNIIQNHEVKMNRINIIMLVLRSVTLGPLVALVGTSVYYLKKDED